MKEKIWIALLLAGTICGIMFATVSNSIMVTAWLWIVGAAAVLSSLISLALRGEDPQAK